MKEICKQLREYAKDYRTTAELIEKACAMLELATKKEPVKYTEYHTGCRQCPSCKVWIPARRKVCLCGTVLNLNTKRIDARIESMYQELNTIKTV